MKLPWAKVTLSLCPSQPLTWPSPITYFMEQWMKECIILISVNVTTIPDLFCAYSYYTASCLYQVFSLPLCWWPGADQQWCCPPAWCTSHGYSSAIALWCEQGFYRWSLLTLWNNTFIIVFQKNVFIIKSLNNCSIVYCKEIINRSFQVPN